MDYLSCETSSVSPESTEREAKTEKGSALPNSVLAAIASGSMAPTRSMLGRRESLAPALQEKMQGAFGADFGNLEVYRSETAKSAGLLGVASGNRVALSPEVNLSSHAGQAVLGHELSHVVAQAKGIGTAGRGLMETPSLERQAMIEGERAANGMRAFAGEGLSADASPSFSDGMSAMGGETLTPISATGGAFGMGAPMQGKLFKPENPRKAEAATEFAGFPAKYAAATQQVLASDTDAGNRMKSSDSLSSQINLLHKYTSPEFAAQKKRMDDWEAGALPEVQRRSAAAGLPVPEKIGLGAGTRDISRYYGGTDVSDETMTGHYVNFKQLTTGSDEQRKAAAQTMLPDFMQNAARLEAEVKANRFANMDTLSGEDAAMRYLELQEMFKSAQAVRDVGNHLNDYVDDPEFKRLFQRSKSTCGYLMGLANATSTFQSKHNKNGDRAVKQALGHLKGGINGFYERGEH